MGCRCERSPSYCAVYPPSMTNSLPVTKDASSEARYSTPYAISSVVPMRPRGVRRSRSSRVAGTDRERSVMGVSITPGCTELHRMPSLAYWVAVDLVNRRTATLEAPYARNLRLIPPNNKERDEISLFQQPQAR